MKHSWKHQVMGSQHIVQVLQKHSRLTDFVYGLFVESSGSCSLEERFTGWLYLQAALYLQSPVRIK